MSVFISGSMSIKELPQEAQRSISTIIAKEIPILVGDAPGVDLLVQEYCKLKGYRSVKVYYSQKDNKDNKVTYPRNNIGNWSVCTVKVPTYITGRDFYNRKDIRMTYDCKYGLCIFDGQSAGTLRNIKHLIVLGKKVAVIRKGVRVDVSTVEHIEGVLRNN